MASLYNQFNYIYKYFLRGGAAERKFCRAKLKVDNQQILVSYCGACFMQLRKLFFDRLKFLINSAKKNLVEQNAQNTGPLAQLNT